MSPTIDLRHKRATVSGRSPSFIDALHAAADAVLRARDACIAMRVRRHHAVESFRQTIAEGSELLKAIDHLMSTELRHDVARLGNWRSVIATPRRLGRPRKSRRRR